MDRTTRPHSNPHRTLVMGAAGRDFHNFLTTMRDDPAIEVVAFTAAQIPGIDGRVLPASLAGPRYPQGIPIHAEEQLESLIETMEVDEVVFAYSDVPHGTLMHKASRVLACGADFRIVGPDASMIRSTKPVISVCAVRTGVGKSGITRRVFEFLHERGLTSVAVRHPMPYRDLSVMAVERYGTLADLDRLGVTLEEREEYEHLIEAGAVVMAGVDYERILRAAEAEADVIVWDGGNNDWPFIASDLEIVALDPHRAGHERSFFPGEVNFLRADLLVINKVDTAPPDAVAALRATALEFNPTATIIETASPLTYDPATLAGKRVLCVEDGPTVTHGGMGFGAAALAARQAGAAELVNPVRHAVGSIAQTFAAYPHLDSVLPAMGYSAGQLADLQATIEAIDCEVVAVGTPIDLARLITIKQPVSRVSYRVADAGSPTLDEALERFLDV